MKSVQRSRHGSGTKGQRPMKNLAWIAKAGEKGGGRKCYEGNGGSGRGRMTMAHFCRTLPTYRPACFKSLTYANSFTYHSNQSPNELQFVEKVAEQKEERRLARGHRGNEPWG